jgi:hypothetical protein
MLLPSGCRGPDLIPEPRANLPLLPRGSRVKVGEIPAVVLLSYIWVWNVGPQVLAYLAWPF